MSVEKIISNIFPTLLVVAAWTALIYPWFTNKPKIEGQIGIVLVGNAEFNNKKYTTFTTFLVLTNLRKNNIQILDYEMEIDAGGGYEKVERVYDVHSIKNWNFESDTDIIDLENFSENLIYRKRQPAEYGMPLQGFVLFASERPQSYFVDKNLKYRVTCIDVFKHKHRFVATEKEFLNLNLVRELADIKITPKENTE